MSALNRSPLLKPLKTESVFLSPPELIPAGTATILDESGYLLLDEDGRTIYEER